MLVVSSDTALSNVESWLKEPNISVDSVRYAKRFLEELDSTADRMDWRMVRVNEEERATVSALWEGKDTTVLVNFHANGECRLHATVRTGTSVSSFENVCWLDQPTDWLALQTTVETVKRLVRV